jgi:spore coat polysaccharide biosynthesis protein SpsF (cytidylyltransferase family)
VALARRPAAVALATTTDPRDDALADYCRGVGVACFRGPVDDVLARYVAACRELAIDPVVRVTGDCPFVCPEALDELLAALIESDADYATYSEPTLHEGIDPFSLRALRALDARRLPPEEREHLALLPERHPDVFRVVRVAPAPALRRREGVSLSIDEPEQLEAARRIYAELDGEVPFSVRELVALLDRRPELCPPRAAAAGRRSAA